MKFLSILLVFPLLGCDVQSTRVEVAVTETPRVLAAPGRIEGASQNIDLGYPGTALVAEVLVDDGELVSRDQVLVRMDCQVLQAELQSAQAEQAVAEEEHARLVRGTRAEELEVARAETEEANAVHKQVLAHRRRVIEMEKKAFSSTYDLDSVQRDLAVARSQKGAALQRLEMLTKGALPEEIRRSEHKIKAAAARKESMRSRLDMCDIRSPVAGLVVRVHVEKGELVSELKPLPVISVADISRFRVRAEIDELDIGQVAIGQTADVVADAFEGKVLHAIVEELAFVMGRKNIRSVDPAEKGDRDVLEVLLALDKGEFSLPIGLRVTVLVNSDQNPLNAESRSETSKLSSMGRYSIVVPDNQVQR